MICWLRDKIAKFIGLIGILLLFIAWSQIEIADYLFECNNTREEK
jgi:hypothetical protein